MNNYFKSIKYLVNVQKSPDFIFYRYLIKLGSQTWYICMLQLVYMTLLIRRCHLSFSFSLPTYVWRKSSVLSVEFPTVWILLILPPEGHVTCSSGLLFYSKMAFGYRSLERPDFSSKNTSSEVLCASIRKNLAISFWEIGIIVDHGLDSLLCWGLQNDDILILLLVHWLVKILLKREVTSFPKV